MSFSAWRAIAVFTCWTSSAASILTCSKASRLQSPLRGQWVTPSPGTLSPALVQREAATQKDPCDIKTLEWSRHKLKSNRVDVEN
jgi:hypothetical protein